MARQLRKLSRGEEIKVLEQHGRICFATGHEIHKDERVEFDHIRAFSENGLTDINNIAPMCISHNRSKGRLALYDFRTKLRMNEFFSMGDRLTLHDLLSYFKDEGKFNEYGLHISVQENEKQVSIESYKSKEKYPLYICPVTDWRYFYATLPVALIDSDDDRDDSIGLQPRYLIPDKVFGLFQHVQKHPVLQPSLGRVVNGHIRLFDGQHKAAAILWNDRYDIECKIYIDHDVRLLNQTNISAHDNFSQTRFYSSIMIMKLGAQFGKDFEEYKNLDDGIVKTEEGFVDYLRIKDSHTRAQVNRRFMSFLYDAIIKDESNKLAKLISVTNRANAKTPISTNGLANSLFAAFLCRMPVSDDITTEAYKRDIEVQNIIKLLNIIYDLALSQWDTKASKNNDTQLKLERFIRTRFMKAWSELIKDAICAKLDIFDQDDKSRPFYRDLDEKSFEDIRRIIGRLIDWKMWDAPAETEIDQIRSDTDKTVKEWVRNNGLTVGYLLGVPE